MGGERAREMEDKMQAVMHFKAHGEHAARRVRLICEANHGRQNNGNKKDAGCGTCVLASRAEEAESRGREKDGP
jgi:hypothetical protein